MALFATQPFPLRWNDKEGHSLRIDTSICDGIEVDMKTEGSDAAVWLPASIETELECWRSAAGYDQGAFIFLSSTGTPFLALQSALMSRREK